LLQGIQNLIDIFGEEFIDASGSKKYADIFLHVEKYIGIYFGASWAAPAQEFDPMLLDFYRHANRINKKLEVIYVNSDEDPG
jgi:hypothetical protein